MLDKLLISQLYHRTFNVARDCDSMYLELGKVFVIDRLMLQINKIQEYIPGIGLIKESVVTRNALSLYLVQFAEVLIPLLTIPYVVRVLGPLNFGISSFVLSLVAYLTFFVDYGFSISATRDISINRDKPKELNRIFTSVLVSKLLLFLMGFIIIVALCLVVPQIRSVYLLVVAGYFFALGNVLFPVWLHQGLEKMKFLAVSNIISKSIMTVLIFLLIRKENGVLMYISILSVAQITNGLITLIHGFIQFKVRLVKINFVELIATYRKGFAFFISNISILAYTTSNAFILGLYLPAINIGLYAASERLLRTSMSLTAPLSQAVFPAFSRMADLSIDKFLKNTKIYLICMTLFSFFIALCVYFAAPLAVKIILGPEYLRSVFLLRLMIPIIIFGTINSVLGSQIIIPLGKEKYFASIVVVAGFVNILAIVLLIPRLKEVAGVVSVTITELFIFLSFYLKYLGFLKDQAKDAGKLGESNILQKTYE